MDLKTLPSSAKVGLEGKRIKNVINIPSHNLLVFSCFADARLRIFKSDDDAKLIRFFDNHSSPGSSCRYVNMVHLFADVLCSADATGNVITWHASSGKVLGSFEGPT